MARTKTSAVKPRGRVGGGLFARMKGIRKRVRVRAQHRFRRLLGKRGWVESSVSLVRIPKQTRRVARGQLVRKRGAAPFAPRRLARIARLHLSVGPEARKRKADVESPSSNDDDGESSGEDADSGSDSDSDGSYVARVRSKGKGKKLKLKLKPKPKPKPKGKEPAVQPRVRPPRARDVPMVRMGGVLRTSAGGGGSGTATAPVAEVGTRRSAMREKIIAALQTSGTALAATIAARLGTIAELKALVASDSPEGTDGDGDDVVAGGVAVVTAAKRRNAEASAIKRQERLDALREELSASCAGAAPLLDAGCLHAAMARTIELSHTRPLELPTIPRAHEEAYMREANVVAGERPCFKRNGCETYAMATARGMPPFVMREFLTPAQEASGALPPVPGECLMCLRLATKLHYVQLLLDGRDARVMITSHWNMCDRPGEYNPDACFLPPGNRYMGIISPVVMHDRDFYTFTFDSASGLRGVQHVDALNFRCMAYGDGKLSGLAPSSLLGRYFGAIGEGICDVHRVHQRILDDGAHAREVIGERAWCACADGYGGGGACACPPFGQDRVFDVARYAIGVLSRMTAATDGRGPTALVARVGMMAYLPLTRRYDAGERNVSLGEAAAMVSVDTAEAGWTLPNVRHILLNSEIWRTSSSYKEGSIEAMLAHMFSKAMPIRCHFRRARAAAVCSSPVDAEEFGKLTTQVLRCSLMGLFRGSVSPPGFDAIRQVDAACAVFSNTGGATWGAGGKRRRVQEAGGGVATVDGVTEGVRRYSYILFAAMKEFVVALVEGDPGLRRMLSLTFDWDRYEREVAASGNALRKRVAEYPVRTAGDWAALNAVAERSIKGHTKHMYTVRRVEIPDLLTASMKDNFMEVSYDEEVYRYEAFDPSTCEARMEHAYKVPRAFAKIVSEAARIYIATGVAPDGLHALNAFDMPNGVARALSLYARDLSASQFFHFQPCSEALLATHRAAVGRRYCVVEAPPPPEAVDHLATFPFCLQCDSWKAPIPSGNKAMDDVVCHFTGVQNVVYDAAKKEVQCRACFDNGRMFSIPLAGNVCRVGKDVFTLCGVCGGVTSLNVRSMLNGRHACIACLQQVLVAEEVQVDRSKTCAYTHCTNVAPTDRGAPAFVVVDDVTAGGDVRVISLCKGHRTVGTKAMNESRVLSVVSAFIENAVLTRQGNNEQVKNNHAGFAKEQRQRRGSRKSGQALMREFTARASKKKKKTATATERK